jgi:hypothetical protein
MASSQVLRCMTFVRTDVSEKRSASFIRVRRISELGTTLAVTSNGNMLLRNYCDPDEGVAKFLWNVGSSKSHTA